MHIVHFFLIISDNMQNRVSNKFIKLKSKYKRYQSLTFKSNTPKNVFTLLSSYQISFILNYLNLVDLYKLYNVFYFCKKTKDHAKKIIQFIACSPRLYTGFQLKQFFSMIALKGKKKQSKWKRNIVEVTDFQKNIKMDVQRTTVWFCHNTQQISVMKEYLWRVLNRLCGNNSHFGYIQGFHSIVKAMFQCRFTQNEAYLLGSYLLKQMKIDIFYRDKIEKIRQICYVLDVYVYNNIPQIFRRLKFYDLFAQSYALSWFLTIFSNLLPLPTLNRLWVLFVIKGWKAILKFTLAMIFVYKQTILTYPQGQLPQFITQLPSMINIFTQRKIWKLYNSIKVTRNMINYLSKIMVNLQFDRQISILNLKNARQNQNCQKKHLRYSLSVHQSLRISGICCDRINQPSFPYCTQY